MGIAWQLRSGDAAAVNRTWTGTAAGVFSIRKVTHVGDSEEGDGTAHGCSGSGSGSQAGRQAWLPSGTAVNPCVQSCRDTSRSPFLVTTMHALRLLCLLSLSRGRGMHAPSIMDGRTDGIAHCTQTRPGQGRAGTKASSFLFTPTAPDNHTISHDSLLVFDNAY